MPTAPATDPTADLYAAWRTALADHDARDTTATHAAEQQAWDALRDACEVRAAAAQVEQRAAADRGYEQYLEARRHRKGAA